MQDTCLESKNITTLSILNCHEGGHPLPGETSEAAFAFNGASA